MSQCLQAIIVTGPTASGKSSLAVSLASHLNAEIINGDAMAVYQGMDIGTAKPSQHERAGVPHHLLDVIPTNDHCNVQRWLDLADAATRDIHQRGKVPIICGGSILSIKAYLEGLSAGPPRDEALRAQLEARLAREGSAALFEELMAVDPEYAAQRHPNDHRRIIRALEVWHSSGKPYSAYHTTDGQRRANRSCLLLAIHWPREILYRRINARCKAMFAAGLVEEVRSLMPQLSDEAAQAVGYKEVLAYLRGETSLDEAAERTRRASRRLAKHQLTWLKRFPEMHWLKGDDPELLQRASQLAQNFLQPPASP
ncbi:MAG: tRNA (adenosine(37)-N6)-dimethylallyltransferase MiaA [Planctomycetota bacterium]|nr:MAG: tRNA (adenosine(37)-N6)-dimethylallyltransferase MiaA [Planctomycetota bacterium]